MSLPTDAELDALIAELGGPDELAKFMATKNTAALSVAVLAVEFVSLPETLPVFIDYCRSHSKPHQNGWREISSARCAVLASVLSEMMRFSGLMELGIPEPPA